MNTTATALTTSTTTAPLGRERKPANLLADKVALVIGAGRGIGAAAAPLFAREGAHVLLASRAQDELKTVTEDIRAAGGIAEYTPCDLADGDSVHAAVERAVELYGRLDAAFNNGATGAPPGPLDQVPLAELERVYAVNLKGTW